MGVGRVLSTSLAVVTVAGCALVVVGMARAGADKQHAAAVADQSTSPAGQPTSSIPAQLPASTLPASPTPARPTPSPTRTAVTSRTAASPTRSTLTSTHPATHVVTHAYVAPPTHASTPKPAAHTTHASTPKPAPKPALRRGVALPLGYSTGSATRVITAVAGSYSSTTATLQPWTKAPGGGWLRVGSPILAHVGSDGLSSSPSESRSATPIGSFSLTHAFGHYGNPGTGLPYVHTTSADWWISQYGGRYSRIYNTLQHCWSNCSFNQGSPNEHLYYETPYYDYAVVIDYNTPNAGPVRQGGGSAFFLHVTDGQPTAGCVAIPQGRLVPIMRWLTPSAHPRILIGVT